MFLYPDRWANSNDSLWLEEGFAAYYSYADLEAKGKLSSDVSRPWKRIADQVLNVARRHKQAYLTVWYPVQFGPDQAMLSTMSPQEAKKYQTPAHIGRNKNNYETNPSHESRSSINIETEIDKKKRHDPYRHQAILQEILPTRTGLDGIKTSAVVWLTKVDEMSPHLFDFVSENKW
jgi:hypothetical protein